MLASEEYSDVVLHRNTGIKRTNSDLTPPKRDSDKKSKMADQNKDIEMPEWAKNLARVEDIQMIMEDFKKNCFLPFQKHIMDRVDGMENELKALKSLPDKIDRMDTDLQESINFNSDDIKRVDKRCDGLECENKELNAKIDALYGMVQNVQREKKELSQKVIELEDRSRRDNLVIDGLEDQEKEPPAECEKKAREYMGTKLNVDNAKHLVLGRVHRIGKYEANKCQSTIIKFDR